MILKRGIPQITDLWNARSLSYLNRKMPELFGLRALYLNDRIGNIEHFAKEYFKIPASFRKSHQLEIEQIMALIHKAMQQNDYKLVLSLFSSFPYSRDFRILYYQNEIKEILTYLFQNCNYFPKYWVSSIAFYLNFNGNQNTYILEIIKSINLETLNLFQVLTSMEILHYFSTIDYEYIRMFIPPFIKLVHFWEFQNLTILLYHLDAILSKNKRNWEKSQILEISQVINFLKNHIIQNIPTYLTQRLASESWKNLSESQFLLFIKNDRTLSTETKYNIFNSFSASFISLMFDGVYHYDVICKLFLYRYFESPRYNFNYIWQKLNSHQLVMKGTPFGGYLWIGYGLFSKKKHFSGHPDYGFKLFKKNFLLLCKSEKNNLKKYLINVDNRKFGDSIILIFQKYFRNLIINDPKTLHCKYFQYVLNLNINCEYVTQSKYYSIIQKYFRNNHQNMSPSFFISILGALTISGKLNNQSYQIANQFLKQLDISKLSFRLCFILLQIFLYNQKFPKQQMDQLFSALGKNIQNKNKKILRILKLHLAMVHNYAPVDILMLPNYNQIISQLNNIKNIRKPKAFKIELFCQENIIYLKKRFPNTKFNYYIPEVYIKATLFFPKTNTLLFIGKKNLYQENSKQLKKVYQMTFKLLENLGYNVVIYPWWYLIGKHLKNEIQYLLKKKLKKVYQKE